jgi:hypothetical protein
VDWVSETADHASQTCEIRMKQRRLPDLAALAEHVSALRLGASLAGVEATVAGTLEEDAGGGLVLRLPESAERLPLAPLRAKIQWSLEKQESQPITPRERDALARLRGQLERASKRVEVVGPLVAEDARVHLEVRDFRLTAPGAR